MCQSRRIIKRSDTDLDQTLDESRWMYYSADWQILEERVDDAWGGSGHTDDRIVQNVYGVRYLDDLVVRRIDAGDGSGGGGGAPDGDFIDAGDSTRFHLTDGAVLHRGRRG